MEFKPSWKSPTFWLAVGAFLVGAVQSSGVLDGSDSASQIVGLIVSVLAALGYTVPNFALKQAQVKAQAVSNIASQETTRAVLGGTPPANPT